MRKPPTTASSEHTDAAFPERWVNIFEAERITGRTRRAIDRWAQEKVIRRKLRQRRTMFEAGELIYAVNEMAKRKAARQFQFGQTCAPGPGRGHKGPMKKKE